MSLMSPLFKQNVAAFLKRSGAANQNGSLQTAVNLETRADALLPKEQFHRILLAEKKRAERTGKNLLLLLIDRGKEDGQGEALASLSRAARSLSGVIRETDITGWFEGNRVLGVIFTEFGDSGLSLAAKVIESKVTAWLQQALPAQGLSKLHMSFYVFPDNWAGNGRTTRLRPQIQEAHPRDKDLREVSAFSRAATADLVSKAGTV